MFSLFMSFLLQQELDTGPLNILSTWKLLFILHFPALAVLLLVGQPQGPSKPTTSPLGLFKSPGHFVPFLTLFSNLSFSLHCWSRKASSCGLG